MAVAGAEDDGFLLRSSGRDEALEQVGTHSLDALGQQEAPYEVGRTERILGDRLRSGSRIHDLLAREVAGVEHCLALVLFSLVEENVASQDLAGREVAVLDPLGHVDS